MTQATISLPLTKTTILKIVVHLNQRLETFFMQYVVDVFPQLSPIEIEIVTYHYKLCLTHDFPLKQVKY